jgi:endoglycosylceramidase
MQQPIRRPVSLPVVCRRRLFHAVAVGFAAALVLVPLVAGCGSDDEGQSGSAGLPALLPLHATRGAGAGIFDAGGRQVLLRGVNVNGLGDYYQANPAYPTVLPLEDADFARMASYGFNVVRLVLSWSALEPERGQISAAYLQRIRRVVEAAKAHGIHTILDMHQDAWGKFIATPPGVECPPGREPAIGWDGAPEWATITDGRSTCREPGARELSFAVAQAFENFYADRDGIQTQLIRTWAALADAFAREPAVAGYDLFNEPHFGRALTGAAPKLADFYTRVIDAIRAAERNAGGFAHIVFFEPVIVWPVLPETPAADFTTDRNIVFAPHNYAESITGFNSLSIEEAFTRAADDAAVYETTFWIGEYGWFSDPPQNQERLRRYAREEDRLRIGSAWWQWEQACGDPHSIGQPNGEPSPLLIHLHYSRCPGDIDEGPVPEWLVVLSRPYPRAAPGALLTLESDGEAGTLRLTGLAGGTTGGRLDLWVPARTGRPRLLGSGFGNVEIIEVPGGYRVLAQVSGSYEVVLEPSL